MPSIKTPKYRFFDHTADILYEAYGRDFKEALENAAKAMFSVIGNAKEKRKINVHVKGENKESLVVRFLETLLSESEIRDIVFSRVKVQTLDTQNFELFAIAYGEKKRPRNAVKAVTFHELQINEGEGRCSIRILLDV
ncbi:MAG: archease [Candidatus Anstonellales archaeon]